MTPEETLPFWWAAGTFEPSIYLLLIPLGLSSRKFFFRQFAFA